MIKKIKGLVLKLAVGALLVTPVAVPAVAHAADEIYNGVCAGSNFDVNNTECAIEGDPGQTLNNFIAFGINIFSVIVGIIAVVMIIVGGLKYITSGGDSGDITGAKNTILYAVIGLVVVALAQFIVHFVLTKTSAAVTGAEG